MNSSRQGLAIGPSTGWACAQGDSDPASQERFMLYAGANAVEFCVGGDAQRIKALQEGQPLGPEFKHRTIHTADFDGSPRCKWKEKIGPIQQLVVRHSVAAVVMHPLKLSDGVWYPCAYYEAMAEAMAEVDSHFAVENMDRSKPSGFDVDELACIPACTGAGFVLDVQHAYEHDHGMGYARHLFEVLQPFLLYYHVSGELGDNNHSLVCEAFNATQIIEFLGWALLQKNAPLILEGDYRTPEKTPERLRREIKFLRKELGL